MKRVSPIQEPARSNPLDLVVLLAVVLVPAAYYLGFNLDWSEHPGEWGERYSLSSSLRAIEPLKVMSMAKPPEPGVSQTVISSAGSQESGAVEDFDQQRWDEMVKRLQNEAIMFPGRVAVYLRDLKRDRTWTYQADDLYPSASLIKVPIMAAVFEKISRGELTMQTRLTLRRRHRVGGSGSLKWYHDGAQFTVRQVLEKMIDESDNTATRMMIETVGLSFLQQQFPKMGLVYTEIYPEGMSLQSSRVTYENYTTAREMAAILEKIYKGEMVDRFSSELMLDLLKHQKSRARLAKSLPVGWEIAHKTGLLRGACHDAAIIFTPEGDFVLTVLTGQNKSYSRAKDFITRIGRVTYRYYKGNQPLYAKTSFGSRRSHRKADIDTD